MNVLMSKKERVFHAVLFELLAIIFAVTGLAIFTEHNISALSETLIVVATMAMSWNVVFNWVFDKFSSGAKEKRSLALRIFHVTLFESGLLIFTVPVMAYMLSVSIWDAFIMDLGMSIFITVYAFVYNLIYDHTRAYLLRTNKVNEAIQ